MRSRRRIKGLLLIVAAPLLFLFVGVKAQAEGVVRYPDLYSVKHIRIYIDKSGSSYYGGELVRDIEVLLYDMLNTGTLDSEFILFDTEVYPMEKGDESVRQKVLEDGRKGARTSLQAVREDLENWKEDGEKYAIILSDLCNSADPNFSRFYRVDGVKLMVIRWANPEEEKKYKKVSIEDAEEDITICNLKESSEAARIKKEVVKKVAQFCYDAELEWISGISIRRGKNSLDEYYCYTVNGINEEGEALPLGENFSKSGYLYYVNGVAACELWEENSFYEKSEFLLLPQLEIEFIKSSDDIYENEDLRIEAFLRYGDKMLEGVQDIRVKLTNWKESRVEYWELRYDKSLEGYVANGSLERGNYDLEFERFTQKVKSVSKECFVKVKAPKIDELNGALLTRLLLSEESDIYELYIYLPDYIGQRVTYADKIYPFFQEDELEYKVAFNFGSDNESNSIEMLDQYNVKITLSSYIRKRPKSVTVQASYKERNEFSNNNTRTFTYPTEDGS